MAGKEAKAGSADSGGPGPGNHAARQRRTGLYNIVDNIVDDDIAGRW